VVVLVKKICSRIEGWGDLTFVSHHSISVDIFTGPPTMRGNETVRQMHRQKENTPRYCVPDGGRELLTTHTRGGRCKKCGFLETRGVEPRTLCKLPVCAVLVQSIRATAAPCPPQAYWRPMNFYLYTSPAA
jgi:hypothetical protein